MYDEPPIHSADIGKLPNYPGYEWINKLPNNKKIFISFDLDWGGITGTLELPKGYDYYILHQYGEHIAYNIIKQQCKNVNGLVIVLHEGYAYNIDNYYKDVEISNVIFLPFCAWHLHCEKMIKWYGTDLEDKNIKKKVSSIANRLDIHKIVVSAAIAKYFKQDEYMMVVRNWIEDDSAIREKYGDADNVRNMQKLFFATINRSNIYDDDEFNIETDNIQKITAAPNQRMLRECAINFANETFITDYIFQDNSLKKYCYPSPFITEKTLKCLFSETGFVAVGQHNTYKLLSDLGFQFNYDFDISWDSIIPIDQRLSKVIDLIKSFSMQSKEEIFDATKESSVYNRNHIISGDFYKICNERNQKTIEKIFNLIE